MLLLPRGFRTLGFKKTDVDREDRMKNDTRAMSHHLQDRRILIRDYNANSFQIVLYIEHGLSNLGQMSG